MYRREVLQALNHRMYNNCFGALNALNALLPKDYRVKIDNAEYKQQTETDITIVCSECEKDNEYKKIKKYQKTVGFIESVLLKTKTVQTWDCLECGAPNVLQDSKLKQSVLQEPYFLTVVPEPPQRKDGIIDRAVYHTKVVQWVWALLTELEERMAQFRDDNWHKQGEMYEEEDLDTSGDEQ